MSDELQQFLDAGTYDRLSLVRSGKGQKAVRAYLGDDAWGVYRDLAKAVDTKHLAVDAPPNLLFAPGIMGSLLQSETKGGVWWVDVRTRKHIDDLALSPDGKEDRDRDNQIEASNVDTTYEPFLTQALAQPDFGHVNFPYDWRKSLTDSASQFADRVDAMHAKSGKPVHLVGHSMGGLMIRAALMEHGDRLWPKVGRILFVGTPHYGATAIAGYLKNHFWGFEMMMLLGLYLSRDTFRTLWGALSLLPAPRGIYPGTRENDPDPWKGKKGDDYVHPCANFDLYDVDSWRLDLSSEQAAALGNVLAGAREFHTRMYDAHLALTNDQRERMAVIAGLGYKTLFRIAYEKKFFGAWDKAHKEMGIVEGDRHREGDSRVPLASAQLDNVRVRYVKGVHGELTNLSPVSGAVFDYLRTGDMSLPDTPAEARSGHLSVDDGAVAARALSPVPGAAVTGDDAGVWKLDVDEAALADLKARAERDDLPEFNRLKLL